MSSSSGVRSSDILFVLPALLLWFGIFYVYHGRAPTQSDDQIVRSWKPELNAVMYKRGFTLQVVRADGDGTTYYEVRMNGMTVWRLDERTSFGQAKVEYLGPVGHEEAYLRDYSIAFLEAEAEYADETSKYATN